MTFISYAQNFEDIRLWRVLRHVENGFYVDVGANHPSHDSVTRAFYERGWNGINIEPVQEFYDPLCQQRPKDINLQCVAGDANEARTFYAVAGTGLSTADADTAQRYRDSGMQLQSQTVTSRTLASICEEHVQGPIHFLKIDVEGHEESVLRGMDFSKWRPWIILVETPWNRDQPWEKILTDASYRPLLFDGLNTFYLAEEQLHWSGAFEIPPCNLDEFQFCYGHKFSHPVAEFENALLEEKQRADRAEAQLEAFKQSRSWRAIHRLKTILGRR
ncbi:FkbM family methyltransferase [Collimonas sp.]|uniref:FkbM family methyltransferase n=1 Tax=Collimonas sp. TaxID=1963772 RepID=UPI002B8FB8FC|nr:FkbM family methyltransferase [Collimonas sp.]HWW06779.1 FkbM family methyltransferase [Collimonas sp.]